MCDFKHQLSERKIEKYLLANIKGILSDYISEAEIAESQKTKLSHTNDIVALNEQLRRLNVIFMTGNISDDEYVKETNRIKVEISKAKTAEKENRPVNTQAVKEFLNSDFESIYATLGKEDQRRMWRSLIEEIYVDGTNVTGVKPRV